MDKLATTQSHIVDLIARRWSGRSFDTQQAVSHEHIIALLEAARWAPSCYGDQPWRFIVWNRHQDSNSWQQVWECLSPGNQGWTKDAPVLILSCADNLFHFNDQPNRHGQYDTGAAVENLCLQATSLSLMSHQMAGFDAGMVRKIFDIPDRYTLMSIIAVGYYAKDNLHLPPDLLIREQSPRQRRPLGELFFESHWNNPIV